MGVNPKELGVYFVEDGEALQGLSLYWSASSLASWRSASFVCETWPAFSGNGPLPPSWTGAGMPPAQSHLPRKGERIERTGLSLQLGTHWTGGTSYHNAVGFLVCYLCLTPPLLNLWPTDQQHLHQIVRNTEFFILLQTFSIRVYILTRSPGDVCVH